MVSFKAVFFNGLIEGEFYMMKKSLFFALCGVAVGLAFQPIAALGYETYAFSCNGGWGSQPRGDGVHFSDTNNWNWMDKGLPTSSLTDTQIRPWMYGKSAINDWNDGFLLYGMELTGLGFMNVLSGNALNLGYGGIDFYDTNIQDGATVCTQRVENVVRAGTKNVQIRVRPVHVAMFDGLLTTLGDDATDKTFDFKNTGKVYLRGGMRIDSKTGDTAKQTFESAGDYYIESDVYVPNVEFKNGAHVVIRNGATFEIWDTANNSFFQQCTIDIEDGSFLNHGKVCSGQNSSMSGKCVINVKSGGVLDTGYNGLRFSNNAPTEFNIYEGGTVWYWNSGSWGLCEGGHTDFNMYGGTLICGSDYSGNGYLPITLNKGSATAFNTTPCTLNLAGGEVFMRGFCDYTQAAMGDTPVNIYLDGVTIRSALSVTDFFRVNTGSQYAQNPTRIHVYMRAGGCTLDTREFDTTWNAVELRSSDLDGGTDGNLVKFGSGKLTVAGPFSFTGTNIVKNGTLAVSDVSYLTGAVDLRPAATLSFTGTTLSLASLASRSGIVQLASGQSLALGEAPAIDGQLVFDVTVANGSRTLLTAPGLTAADAALCAVKTPVAGKSCTFSVDGNSLVLTVADGTAPDAPVYPSSEDPEVNQRGSTIVITDASVERIGGYGTFKYAAAADKEFGAGDIRMSGNLTLSVSPGAGDVTISGAPAKSTTDTPTLTLSTAWNGLISLTGDWSWRWPYTALGYVIGTGAGRFIYGPDLEPENLFGSLNFAADSSHTVCRSTLALEASHATAADPMQPAEAASFILDGGTVKVAGAGTGSLNDFLRGVTSFALGAGGGTIDTCGYDVTITQTLTPTGAVSGTLTKDGEGSLTLAGRENAIFGELAVSNGTLVAAFDTATRRPYPEGALAIWSFDGDDPYSDKTGHGYDLQQAHPEVAEVTFTDENGMSGKAARWSSTTRGGALYVSPENITQTTYTKYRQTISAWVRYTGSLVSYATILSTRTKVDFASGAGNSFDLSYKYLSEAAGGGYGFSSLWNAGRTAIPDSLVGHAPALDTWHHLVMVADNYDYKSYLDGVCYRHMTNEVVNGVNSNGFSGQFLPDGYIITLGQGFVNNSGNAEMMALGGMVDEVAVYPRRLSEGEIQALYHAQARSGAFDLTVAAGATWNMNASTSTVKRVAGSGTVANGKLTVTERLVTDPASADALAVDAITFAPGGAIDLGYAEGERRATGRRTLLRFSELDEAGRAAVSGWGFVNAGTDLRSSLSFRVAADGLYLDVTPVGTTFIIR